MNKRILLYMTLSLLLFACGPGKVDAPVEEKPLVQETETAPASTVPAAAVELAAETEGLAVFVAGDVFIHRDGSEEYLEIGEPVFQDDVVVTASDGYCEIQMGDIAVVRVEADSVLELQSLMTREEGSRMAVELESGTVLCKVKKLLDEDSFQVKTNTVVCGVRGTQFRVSSDGEAVDTLLAVKEGAVAVTPRSLDRVSELAAEEDTLKNLAAVIEEKAVVVGAAQEITVKADSFEEMEELTEIVEAVVRKVEEKKKAKTLLEEQGAEAAPETLTVLEEELSAQVEKLRVSLEATPEAVAPEVLEVQEISEESREILEATDAMELIEIPVAAKAATAEKSTEAAPKLYNIQLDVAPAEAVITQNGIILGKGSFAKIYPGGTSLRFEISLDGYETQVLDMVAGEESAGSVKVELKETVSPEAALPAAVAVETAAPAVEKPVAKIAVEVRVEPSDAALSINGSSVSGGSWSGEESEGSTLEISASRRGYEPGSRSLTVSAETASFVIRLKPRPVEKTSSLGITSPVGIISEKGDLFVAADGKGTVTAFNRNGNVLWSQGTANAPNANSSPVVYGGRVYFSGASELVVLSASDGSVVNRISLPEERSHIYGRRVVALDDNLILPANNELVLISASGEDVKSIPVAGGSSMSPAVWGGKAVLADKKGALLVIDPSSGSVLSSVPTAAVQSVAQSPSIFGDRAVFCSRKGIVAAVDLKQGTVLWERNLDRTVFADVITTDEGCFVYTTKKELFALSWDTGEDLYSPMSAVSSLPGYEKGEFVFTDKNGILKIVDAGSGKLMKQHNLAEAFTAKPIVRDGIIIAVGKSGQFYRIDREGIVD